MTGHALHLPKSIKLTAVSRIAACFAMAFGVFAGAGCASGGAGSNETGGAGSEPTNNPNGGIGVGTGGGGAGEAAALMLDTGRTVIRRLNRTEYTLTVRDLLGTSMKPLASLDPESAYDLFDTVGEF